ncbi:MULTISPECIES: restriction endonuclease subunit S [Bacillus cereus group]|uniref:restriction endonuclease subunit S n=1 Tax=Bacillus cereus group TaxID=86661 RepID=UPI000B443902|nr:restriction endonuclease subunit S [Bacillus thuringiensis]ARZ61192.1 hypothetical protein B7P25_04980 [Bacillus thuringiensis]
MNSGWKKLKIKEFTKVLSGGTPKSSVVEYYEGGTIGWITPSDLTGYNRQFINEGRRNITNLGLEKSSAKLLPAGTVLFSSRAPIGYVAIAENELTTNQGFKNILPSPMHNPKYLYWYLKSVKDEIEFRASGTTFKEISASGMNEIEVPLPSLEEQTKIVAVLDKAQALIEKRREAIVKLDELVQSIFLDMFGDPSNNEKGFLKGKIKDLILEAKYGTSKKSNENEGEFPYLRMNNLTYKGYMDFSNLKYIDLDEKEQDKYLVQEGDLLFNRTNSKELVGKTAVFEEKEPMAIAGYLIRVRVNEIGNPYYISSYLNSKHGKMILQNMCKNIVGMANINAKEMQNIDILIPQKALQDKYEEQYKEILKKKHAMNRQLEKLELHFQSVLQKAFKGELEVNTEIKA